jgi:hypothetical protein
VVDDYVRDASRLTFAIRNYLYYDRETGERTHKIKNYIISLHLPNRKVICECSLDGELSFNEINNE